MRESVFETLIGLGVVAAAGIFFLYAINTGGSRASGGARYDVTAIFDNVSGIARGSDVRLSGVKIGLVKGIEPKLDTYEAKVVLALQDDVVVPVDSLVKIMQDGLLGGSFVALEPGRSHQSIPTDGSGQIDCTLGSIDLAGLVGSITASGGPEPRCLSRTRYEVSARFNNVSGIAPGSDVRLAGVKIGQVATIQSDLDRFDAVVTLLIDQDLQLPDDTDARISSDGLLGGAYIALEPGGGFDLIAQDGTGEIIYTRGSVDLLTLVGSFASNIGGDEGNAQ